MADFYNESLAVVDRPITIIAGKFWREFVPVIDEKGKVVKGGMWPHQKAWWDLPTFIKIMVGGYGAGKTLIGCKRILASALVNAPCPVGVISPTFPIARQTVIKTLIELLDGKVSLYGRRFWWRYNASSHEFKIRFHGRTATIIVNSGDRPLSLRGPNLAAAYIDEPFIQDVEVFTQMIARVRHPNATEPEIFMTGTPEQLNWGYDLCEGDLSDKHDVGFVRASSRQNLALNSSYVDRLLGAFSDKAAQAYVEGYFENLATGMVYHAFDRRLNVVEQKLEDSYELGCGMDFNVDPMSACVFWRAGNHLHFFEEYELPNADTEYLCDELKEKWGDRLHDIYPDASGVKRSSSSPGGKSDFWYIQNAGFSVRAPNANPHRKDRYNAVNGKFKSRKGSVTLTVDPKCKKLIKYLSVYSHELMLKQKDMSHLLDAFSYPVSYLFPVSKDTLGQYKLTGV